METPQKLSAVAVPFNIPTSSARGSLFSTFCQHLFSLVLALVCCSWQRPFWRVWGDISLWLICISLVMSGGEGSGTHSSALARKIPRTGSLWAAVRGVTKSRTRLSSFTSTFHFHALENEMATHSSVLAWRIPGTGSLVGCCLWGRRESDTTEAT